ncbi:hypothetical protein ABPG74_021132 [Tetrahymena malaccensis]
MLYQKYGLIKIKIQKIGANKVGDQIINIKTSKTFANYLFFERQKLKGLKKEKHQPIFQLSIINPIQNCIRRVIQKTKAKIEQIIDKKKIIQIFKQSLWALLIKFFNFFILFIHVIFHIYLPNQF